MRNSLISLGQVSARVSLGRTTIYDLIKSGRFPRQIQVTPNRVAWIAEEVDQWISDRVSASRNEETQNV